MMELPPLMYPHRALYADQIQQNELYHHRLLRLAQQVAVVSQFQTE